MEIVAWFDTLALQMILVGVALLLFAPMGVNL